MIDDFSPVPKPAATPARIPNMAVVPEPVPEILPTAENNNTTMAMLDPKKPQRSLKDILSVVIRKIRKPKNKREWAIVIIVLTIIIGTGITVFALTRPDPASPPSVTKEEPAPEPPPPPTTESSKLTGVEVALELNKRPVTGVMIENSPDARPQAGLKDAGIVFEAVAEGGITRFLALYQEAQPDRIGPVRSVRPYYLDWLVPFDAAVAHVGGSPAALAKIKVQSIKDLDQFVNSGAYERVSNRFAPHNVYTSMARLDALNQTKGYTTTNFTGFSRKPETPLQPPAVTYIDFNISSFLYNVHYDYDAASNSYKRNEGGKPHLDEQSAAQLSPKVVIAIVVSKGIAADGVHTEYTTSASGRTFIFQNGGILEGTWHKSDPGAQLIFTDAAGAPLGLNPGQTWVTVLGEAGSVSYK